jgi:hypothetical protein
MSVYPLSFSRMQVFEQCAYRFEGQYVTREYLDAGSDASKFGNWVHDSFENYLRSGDDLLPELHSFRGLLDQLREMPGDKFYEHEMAVKQDKKPCKWDAANSWMRGIADFAVVRGDLGFAGDWKTGRPRDDTQQLKLMACLLFEHFPQLQTVTTSYFWLYHPTASAPPNVYTRDMLPDLWRLFERKARAVNDAVIAGVFKPTPSGLCPWCPRYNTCSYAKRRK